MCEKCERAEERDFDPDDYAHCPHCKTVGPMKFGLGRIMYAGIGCPFCLEYSIPDIENGGLKLGTRAENLFWFTLLYGLQQVGDPEEIGDTQFAIAGLDHSVADAIVEKLKREDMPSRRRANKPFKEAQKTEVVSRLINRLSKLTEGSVCVKGIMDISSKEAKDEINNLLSKTLAEYMQKKGVAVEDLPKAIRDRLG